MRKFINYLLLKLKIVRGSINKNDRFGGIHMAWGHIFSNHLEGDYVEFGIYKGDGVVSSLQCHQEFMLWLARQKRSDEEWRRDVSKKSPLNKLPVFHCLDTFEGMPENHEGSISFEKNTFNAPLSIVKQNIEKKNSLGCKISYYKGLFKDTASQLKKKLGEKKAVIVNIDCDLMESTVDSLNAISDHIDIGTVILFDDYNAFNADQNKGQRKALNNFLKHSNFLLEKFYTYHYSGQAFLVIGRKN